MTKRTHVRELDPTGGTDGQVPLISGGEFVIGTPAGGLDAEGVRDTIAAALVAGAGITITPNDAGDTITLAASAAKAINAQVGTTYTLALTDAGPDKWVQLNNAAAITLTVPPNSTTAFPVGSCVEGSQAGAGQVTIAAGAGVTINATPGLKVAGQHGTFGLLKLATDTWLAYGRLAA